MTDQPNSQQPLPLPSGLPTVSPTHLTLRDWFAGLAMQGLLSCELDHDGKIQVSAYEYADRMLAERAKK